MLLHTEPLVLVLFFELASLEFVDMYIKTCTENSSADRIFVFRCESKLGSCSVSEYIMHQNRTCEVSLGIHLRAVGTLF